ncbi:Receptor-interacting serine/threonine-protein kinase 1 [Blastocladiella emersonii ATCC 22665]|nr:Receptor-interacting serine/threonine-protein kinase 1 [Blastocladiella emersonii ATCC 22665]
MVDLVVLTVSAKIITGLVASAAGLQGIAHSVKVNNEQCQLLARRVVQLAEMLDELARAGELAKVARVEDTLADLASLVDQAQALVESFSSKTKWHQRLLTLGSFRSAFNEINDRLSHVMQMLDVQINVASLFNPDDDKLAEEADAAHIREILDSIVAMHTEELALLNGIYVHQEDLAKKTVDSLKDYLRTVVVAPQPLAGDRFQHLEIPYWKLIFEEEIGRGGFGVVYRGTYQGEQVAIKVLDVQRLGPAALKDFKCEVDVLRSITSRYIPRLYGICTEHGRYCIVLEHMARGNLSEVLRDDDVELPWPLRYRIALEAARGMQLLYANNVQHRDLKSLNVLLDEYLHAKVSDFGLAKSRTSLLTTASATATRSGTEPTDARKQYMTLAWTAPERLRAGGRFTEACDVYSFGMMLYEVASREYPFDGEDPLIVRMSILEGARPEIPDDTPPEFAALIRDCWAQDASVRPGFEEVARRLDVMSRNDPVAVGSMGGGGAAVQGSPSSTLVRKLSSKHDSAVDSLSSLGRSSSNGSYDSEDEYDDDGGERGRSREVGAAALARHRSIPPSAILQRAGVEDSSSPPLSSFDREKRALRRAMSQASQARSIRDAIRAPYDGPRDMPSPSGLPSPTGFPSPSGFPTSMPMPMPMVPMMPMPMPTPPPLSSSPSGTLYPPPGPMFPLAPAPPLPPLPVMHPIPIPSAPPTPRAAPPSPTAPISPPPSSPPASQPPATPDAAAENALPLELLGVGSPLLFPPEGTVISVSVRPVELGARFLDVPDGETPVYPLPTPAGIYERGFIWASCQDEAGASQEGFVPLYTCRSVDLDRVEHPGRAILPVPVVAHAMDEGEHHPIFVAGRDATIHYLSLPSGEFEKPIALKPGAAVRRTDGAEQVRQAADVSLDVYDLFAGWDTPRTFDMGFLPREQSVYLVGGGRVKRHSVTRLDLGTMRLVSAPQLYASGWNDICVIHGGGTLFVGGGGDSRRRFARLDPRTQEWMRQPKWSVPVSKKHRPHLVYDAATACVLKFHLDAPVDTFFETAEVYDLRALQWEPLKARLPRLTTPMLPSMHDGGDLPSHGIDGVGTKRRVCGVALHAMWDAGAGADGGSRLERMLCLDTMVGTCDPPSPADGSTSVASSLLRRMPSSLAQLSSPLSTTPNSPSMFDAKNPSNPGAILQRGDEAKPELAWSSHGMMFLWDVKRDAMVRAQPVVAPATASGAMTLCGYTSYAGLVSVGALKGKDTAIVQKLRWGPPMDSQVGSS